MLSVLPIRLQDELVAALRRQAAEGDEAAAERLAEMMETAEGGR